MNTRAYFIFIFLTITVFVHPALASSASGLGAFSSLTNAMGFGPASSSTFGYGGSTTFANGASSITQHRLTTAYPVTKDNTDTYSLYAVASSLHFGDTPVLSGPSTVVAKDFYRVELGAHFSRRLENGHGWGGRFSVGSASDRLFAGTRDMIFTATANYSFPGSETSHWVLTVFISNNSPIANSIPIPGFIYLFRTNRFIGMFGLPFASFQWTPFLPWTLAVTIFGPSINSEIIYGERGHIQGFAGFNWNPQSFLRHDRALDQDRLFVNEMKAVAGVRSPLNSNLSGELSAGYAFNRSVFEGPRFDKRDRGHFNLQDAWLAQWNLRYIF